ncbi:MAG: hypothetical protein RIC55_36615 [Pirellulaceae bacterium]
MLRFHRFWACAAVLLALPLAAQAEDRPAAQLLPPTTVLYAEAPRPNEVLELLLTHPLRSRFEQVEQYREALKSAKFAQFQAVVTIVEAQLGLTWREALEGLQAGGVFLAADSETEGVALLVRARDEAALDKIRETFINLARADARRKGKEDPIKTGEYREQAAYQIDKGLFTTLGPWLVVVNKQELGKRIIDCYLDGGDSLADRPVFQSARKEIAGQPTAWAWLDMQAVRDSGKAHRLEEGRTDNPVAELIGGGLIDNLQQTPYLAASVYLDASQFRLSLSSPHNTQWVDEPRWHFFGKEGEGAAPPMLEAPRMLASVSAYRDVSRMWLHADDLFDAKTSEQISKANGVLTTLFSGRDFGEDVLSAVEPGFQVVVARQDFEGRLPRPSIKLPAAAVVSRLKDPERMQGELRRMFLNFVGFVNFAGGTNGQPQLDFDIEKEGDTQIISTRYLPDVGEKDSTDARINFNFSPSVAFVGDVVIVASTEQLARDLMKHAAGDKEQRGEQSQVNSAVTVDLSVLRDVLDDNRQHLIAQNMLKEGHTREEAEQQVGILLTVLDVFKQAKVQLLVEKERLVVETVVQLKPQDAP